MCISLIAPPPSGVPTLAFYGNGMFNKVRVATTNTCRVGTPLHRESARHVGTLLEMKLGHFLN